jgi:hypothetical protein
VMQEGKEVNRIILNDNGHIDCIVQWKKKIRSNKATGIKNEPLQKDMLNSWVGKYDPLYVDAYYGPKNETKEENLQFDSTAQVN